MKTSILVSLLLSVSAPAIAFAETPPVTFDGFVDAYYAYDLNGPPSFDRAYTTQPARSDEFNVNLMYLGASLSRPHLRGRVALQAGTSVQNNYAGEPVNGAVSGPTLSRNIQEAYVGTALSPDLWLDGGIYFSHVGGESFISKNNLSYTRSLVADFSPYYQSGLRLSYKATGQMSFQLHLINGWQNISENNHSKMVGTQVLYAPSESFSVSYNTLIGREAEFRQFHDFVVTWKPSEKLSLLGQYDFGLQTNSSGQSLWQGFTAIGKYQLTPSFAFNARVENYRDPDQVIVSTGSPHGFQTWSSSIGVDETVDENITWRTEFRLYWSEDALYPGRDGLNKRDGLAVTSLNASF